MRRISKPSVLAFSTSRRYLGVERTVSTPTVWWAAIEVSSQASIRWTACRLASSRANLSTSNALRQDIRVDDPDRASERFDAGVLIGAALARTVRAGDEQEDGRLS